MAHPSVLLSTIASSALPFVIETSIDIRSELSLQPLEGSSITELKFRSIELPEIVYVSGNVVAIVEVLLIAKAV